MAGFLDSGQLVGELVHDDHTGHVDWKVDTVRGQYPKNPASGWKNFTTNGQKDSLLLGLSAHWFKWDYLWINNDLGIKNAVVFYDGPGVTVTIGKITVDPSNTAIVDIKGLYVQSGLHASNVDSGLQLRVGGYLVKSQL